MITSRSIEDLLPAVREKAYLFLAYCKDRDVDALITSTYRDLEAQAELFRRGRTAPGAIVTNAGAGESFHNYRVAFDAVPLILGKPLWQVFDTFGIMDPHWKVFSEAAAAVGLEWAGNWKAFREYCHFQDALGRTIEQWKRSLDR